MSHSIPPAELQTARIALAIKQVMRSNGVRKADFASTLAKITGLSLPHAYKKLAGRVSMTDEQIDAVAQFYGIEPAEIIQLGNENSVTKKATPLTPATLLIGSLELPCGIELAGRSLIGKSGGRYRAYSLEQRWYVRPWGDCAEENLLFDVAQISLEVELERRIAVIDDEVTGANNLRDYLNRTSFSAAAFYDSATAELAIHTRPFDGYVVDWLLGSETSERLIHKIRLIQPTVPVIVITAGMQDGLDIESDLANLVTRFGVTCHMKPVKMQILTAQLTDAFTRNAYHA